MSSLLSGPRRAAEDEKVAILPGKSHRGKGFMRAIPWIDRVVCVGIVGYAVFIGSLLLLLAGILGFAASCYFTVDRTRQMVSRFLLRK